MAIQFDVSDPVGIVSLKNFDIQPGLPDQITVKEINIVESLLSPAVQVSATIQSEIYNPPGKDFDQHKNKELSFSLSRSSDGAFMQVKQQVYRLDHRNLVPVNIGAVEEMTFHAIDKTVLKDAQTLISRSWKCTQPSEIVSAVLEKCLEAKDSVVKKADPARDYIAENIHPFQVIAQQANVGVDRDDPSFLHFMTLNNQSGEGVHHFESLKSLTEGNIAATFYYGDSVWSGTGGYQSKDVAITFSFPCDFDYLSDILNGLNENGENQNTGFTTNPLWKLFSGISPNGQNFSGKCGMGGYNYKQGLSNKDTATQQNSCNLDVETHLFKRQARMGLLEPDKIALRLTVPWRPDIHAGNLIKLIWHNKHHEGVPVYGQGEYLVSSLMHTIKFGGFSTTTMDCVSKSVGRGEV